ncbi:hypothetical protein PCCS19_03750 [Paenibacillus sp. CCS19]|uniref:VOC family protein n=1 Tax=Paenibacillus sp. CCS19 TaxID=3158387 RepID=UPI002566F471|nr:VOC family protein [Paenibacillus cellulosilyticus]GMK37322.1 hypothetical protein PCCS19_03750 [Paenibacillus cellulosilyticus]
MSMELHASTSDLLMRMAEGNDIAARTEEGYVLDSGEQMDNRYVWTPKAYQVPVRIEVVAMTDSSNIRIKFAKAQFIFNWERNYDHLRATEPAKGKTCHQLGAGRVPVGEWVSFVWIVEPSYMKLIVNGEERLHIEGKFGRVSGQAAIGPAFRSKVTVRSFHVQGVEVEPAPPKPKPLLFEFDECHIAVPQELHQEAVDWYCKFLRMDIQRHSRISPIHETLQGTLLEFRHGKGAIGIVSSPQESGHFGVDWGKKDGARFVLKTGNLQATRHFLIQQGVRTTPIVTGLSGVERFDLFDPFGTCLTVMKDESLDGSTAGTVGFTVPVITVSNVKQAREWYAKHLGMRRNARRSKQGADLMMGLWRFNGVREPAVWLEEQNVEDRIERHVLPATRMYFYVEPHRFEQSYKRWQTAGAKVSDIEGRAYHVYDPDGNRINVFTC